MTTRYGRWTLLHPGPYHTHDQAPVQCDCGTKTTVRYDKLTRGKSKSCGCLRRQQLTQKNRQQKWPDLAPYKDTVVEPGAHFGRWTILEKPHRRGKALYAWCQCECGTKKNVATHNLLHDITKSCGCLRKEGAQQLHKPKKA